MPSVSDLNAHGDNPRMGALWSGPLARESAKDRAREWVPAWARAMTGTMTRAMTRARTEGLLSVPFVGFVLGLVLTAGLPAQAHPAELNNRVMFVATGVAFAEVLGEEALVIGAVLDNGLRNRLTLRGLTSTAGAQTKLYATKTVYGQDNLIERRTFALRSGQGVSLEPPDFLLVITGLTEATLQREPFELTLTFNRAVGAMTLPISFEPDETEAYGFAEIDLGPPKALVGDYVWLTPDDEEGAGAASAAAGSGG